MQAAPLPTLTAKCDIGEGSAAWRGRGRWIAQWRSPLPHRVGAWPRSGGECWPVMWRRSSGRDIPDFLPPRKRLAGTGAPRRRRPKSAVAEAVPAVPAGTTLVGKRSAREIFKQRDATPASLCTLKSCFASPFAPDQVPASVPAARAPAETRLPPPATARRLWLQVPESASRPALHLGVSTRHQHHPHAVKESARVAAPDNLQASCAT